MDEQAIVGTTKDPAWPLGRSATLHTTAVLPHGWYPTVSACSSMKAAMKAAEDDARQPLTWQERDRRSNGQRVFSSGKIPYKSGTVHYTIWA